MRGNRYDATIPEKIHHEAGQVVLRRPRRPLAWPGERDAGATTTTMMALYLSRFTYTPQTWARLIANPEDRRKAAQSYIESVGGKLHGFWYAFGTHDGYNLWEAPDNVSIWPRSRWRSAEAARLARWKRRFS